VAGSHRDVLKDDAMTMSKLVFDPFSEGYEGTRCHEG